MVKVRVRIPLRVLRYFRENPGSVFIIAFQILLIVAAVCLIYGNTAFANEVAIYAYYSLVVGVAMQLVAVVRGGAEEREAIKDTREERE